MIPKGAVVFKNGTEKGPRYTWEQIEKFTPEERAIVDMNCFPVEDDLYECPRTIDEIEADLMYVWNHSCDPNTLIIDDDITIASRDILVGEELTIDYGTYQADNSFRIKNFENCKCGAKDCRRKVSPNDYQDEKFRNKYYPHFGSHVMKKIEAYLKEQTLTQNQEC